MNGNYPGRHMSGQVLKEQDGAFQGAQATAAPEAIGSLAETLSRRAEMLHRIAETIVERLFGGGMSAPQDIGMSAPQDMSAPQGIGQTAQPSVRALLESADYEQRQVLRNLEALLEGLG